MSDLYVKDEISASESQQSTPSPDEIQTDGSNYTTAGTAAISSSIQSQEASSAASLSADQAARRQPRKSTLTQQQKNQKRQRATQDQLVTLEHEFIKNPTPTAATRERIAAEINMTERSVQIWFQNSRRRAKIKLMAKKGLDISGELEHLPESMRQLIAMQAMQGGGGGGSSFPSRFVKGGPMGYNGTGIVGNSDAVNGKVVIQHFTCRSLSIGTWRRVGQNAMDLVIFFSPERACMTYYINNDCAGYKIEYPFAFIKSVTIENNDQPPSVNGSPPRMAGLVVELTRPPNFFMDSPSSGGFYQCGDFTEDQQASKILTHHLGGQPKQLSGQLQKLLSLDSFQNRHSLFDIHPLPASAPVSPNMGIARPASQPQFVKPYPPGQLHLGEPRFHGPAGMQHVGMPQGHKRQRSRSVPIAIDFSMLHGPMPTFNIQQPSPQDFNHPQPAFFQPVPQHPQHPNIGPNLQIDTSSGYGMDMRSLPMSAGATTPSEFASPGFYSQQQQQQQHGGPQVPPAEYSTPYSMPFLSPSPMVDGSHMMPPQSISPLSHVGHAAEPLIVNDSPSIGGMNRSASADMFTLNNDHRMHDDSLMLSDMYAKQNLNMPMPSPSFIDENGMLGIHDMQDFHTPMEHPDMNLSPFGTIDPNSLGVHH